MSGAAGSRTALALSALLLVLPGCRGDESLTAAGPLVIRVKGEEYEWLVRYPGADGALDTADDVVAKQDLHVPLGMPVEIELESADYVYGFRIPDFGINQIAVPELSYKASFEAAEAGSHPLKGDQLCGYRHKSLLGTVVVHSRSGFGKWLEQQAATKEVL